METDIAELKTAIYAAFNGVRLGGGVSWREADVIDDYGSQEARTLARALDEQRDWTIIPPSLIGNNYYNAVPTFLDDEGFRFYLAPMLLFVLDHYHDPGTDLIGGFLSRLTDKRGFRLRKSLTDEQATCVRDFLRLLKNEPEFSFERIRMGSAAGGIWN